ncbi:MAG: EscU/YscU/HrcU family type III secretion system export apparatus switch protein, partial [Gammaproteobacteria bacterium]
MAADDTEDRTEEATEKRLEDAKTKGQVVRSKEWGHFISMLSSVILFWLLFDVTGEKFQKLTHFFWKINF